MIIYVTGHHRAGTHSFAEFISRNLRMKMYDENTIGLDNYDLVMALTYAAEGEDKKSKWYFKKALKPNQSANLLKNYNKFKASLKNGIVIQCPYMAHKVIELSKHGTVYWCVRTPKTIVTSMANCAFGIKAWNVMRAFKSEFPDDPIWKILKYDGSNDAYNRFVKYYDLLYDVKQYFYNKYFADKVKLIQLEQQPYYDVKITLSHKTPLKPAEKRWLES